MPKECIIVVRLTRIRLTTIRRSTMRLATTRPAPLLFTSIRVLVLSFFLLALAWASEPRRITVYAPQKTYQVEILERAGADYVGVADLLAPLGHLESRVGGKKFTLTFNGVKAEFHENKRQVRAGETRLDLDSDFVLLDGRGYIPVASLSQLLPIIAGQPVEFHSIPRHLFVGSPQIRFSAELRHAPVRLVLRFTAPVNPSVLADKGRIHLFFHAEPVVSNGAEVVNYNDPFLQSTSFAEEPGGAEFVANVGQPTTIAIAPDGRTVTIAAVVAPPPPPPLPPPTQPGAASSALVPPAPPPPVLRVRPFVVLDPSHGGKETGAVLSPALLEKAVTLALARRLQQELAARGIPVVLTRTADNLLTPDQRAISANTSRASLYVALHAATTGHGVRLYTAMLPEVTNDVLANAPQPDPTTTRRRFLPWERAQFPYLQQSAHAAAALAVACTSEGLPVYTSAVPLPPLNHVTIPAVAVEIAPLGFSADELADSEYQRKIATALATAIASLRGQLEAEQ